MSVFALPESLSRKADPSFVARDEEHFAAIAATLDATVAELSGRLDETRATAARGGQEALDRDQEVHRLTARLRSLRQFGLETCLGRVVAADDPDPVYIGRLGLTDSAGQRLLLDWRSPAAEPFFAATHAHPAGLASRRRYRWTRGRVTDFWDEVFTPDGLDAYAALDDQSAFIASLGADRSERMRDVLGTIQADQDAIIRAGSAGTLVVDGGPGTGKTVVALHRSAYLLYEEPRLRERGVLFVGPHEPYLAYVSDVLPSLGEDAVQLCTLRDLVAEGAAAVAESTDEVARLKADARVGLAVDRAVRFYEEPPAAGMDVAVEGDAIRLTAADWAEAFEAPDPGTPHNDARNAVWQRLLDILEDSYTGALPDVRNALQRNRELGKAFNAAWPLVDAADLVGDLWSVPAYLRHCAPWLTADEVKVLQRSEVRNWTTADLPWLDLARQRLGDPEASRRQRRQRAALAVQRSNMDDVVADLVESDDSEMQVMSMFRVSDVRDALVDESVFAAPVPDALAGPFGHVVVDEAQELTDAEWQQLLQRCPSRSFTVVGDRAQARHGFTETWEERLRRVGFDRVAIASLTINYRTPAEVMAAAEPVIRVAIPDANVPTSVRSTGLPVQQGSVADLADTVEAWLAAHPDGTACVIGNPGFAERPRVRSLTPELAKGLEFDLVVVVDPEAFGDGIEGAVDRYVAMTRATQHLAVLRS